MKIFQKYPDKTDLLFVAGFVFVATMCSGFTLTALWKWTVIGVFVTLFDCLVWQLKQVVRAIAIGFLGMVVAGYFISPQLHVMSFGFFVTAALLILYVYLFVVGFRTKK